MLFGGSGVLLVIAGAGAWAARDAMMTNDRLRALLGGAIGASSLVAAIGLLWLASTHPQLAAARPTGLPPEWTCPQAGRAAATVCVKNVGH